MKLTWSCAAFLSVVMFAGCGGGGGSTGNSGSNGGNPIPVVSPTASASMGPVNEAAYACPTSDTASASSRSSTASLRRGRLPTRVASSRQQQKPTALIAVSYDRATATASHRLLAASEARAGGTFRNEFDYARLGITLRVLAVPAAQVARTEAALRAQAGVRGVEATGGRRYPLAVTAPYYTNDPYFEGFTPAQTGSDAPTFQAQPLVESANVPGQWGAHKTQLDYAFEYSQQNNGSSVSNPLALGSANVKIAIIDTGADLTQPELSASKVTRQGCFITDPSGNQSTSNFVTDPDGHGTNVSGIAGAAANNGIGFTGEGGNSELFEYRVNPTPDAACFDDPPSTTDDQCAAVSTDVSSAIDAAVASGANVISMSLGGDDCKSPGVDQDPVEAAAVANAIAHSVVVVAAAGNGGTSSDTSVTSPACDTGVIAVGATALADGQPNGAGNSDGSAVAPNEYVASYSSYGSTTAALHNANAWGIVAPGGDPQNSMDADNLHWINNIWTSTPSVPAKDAGTCGQDYGGTGTAAECQTLIAGTSMSTPLVAGAAALIIAVNPAYKVPAQMKSLLCSTTDDLGSGKEGCGRLNVYRAMAVALNDPVIPASKVRR